jgi:CheY-like chemotaxis protein
LHCPADHFGPEVFSTFAPLRCDLRALTARPRRGDNRLAVKALIAVLSYCRSFMTAAGGVRSRGRRLEKIRVAIAEDHALLRAAVREYLSKSAPDVEVVGEAVDGREALAVLASTAVDVLLLDISMPEINGQQVLREMKRAAPNVVVVVLSAHPREWIERDETFGAVSAYLQKGAHPADILAAIRKAASLAGAREHLGPR